jgi:Uma2 family endonuclease
MNVALQKPWTQERFFSWAENQDIRYEFDGFRPVAMTGGNVAHSRLIRNLSFVLTARLRGKPCEPMGPDAGVETVNKAVRYPDALVTCAKAENASYLVPGVVVVFEVLSPTSGQTDRIIESSSVGLTVMQRTDGNDPWTTTVLTIDDTLDMPEIGIAIPVAEIYENIEFSDQENVSS